MSERETTRKPPRGWMNYQGAWMPKRRVKRLARKAMEQNGGYARRDCYMWPR